MRSGRIQDSLNDDDQDNVDAYGQTQPDPLDRNARNNNNGKVLLEFSSFADSCRRNADIGREGDFAFNLTRIGMLPYFTLVPIQLHFWVVSNPNINKIRKQCLFSRYVSIR